MYIHIYLPEKNPFKKTENLGILCVRKLMRNLLPTQAYKNLWAWVISFGSYCKKKNKPKGHFFHVKISKNRTYRRICSDFCRPPYTSQVWDWSKPQVNFRHSDFVCTRLLNCSIGFLFSSGRIPLVKLCYIDVKMYHR